MLLIKQKRKKRNDKKKPASRKNPERIKQGKTIFVKFHDKCICSKILFMKRLKICLFLIIMMYAATGSAQIKKPTPPLPPRVSRAPQPPKLLKTDIAKIPTAPLPPLAPLDMKEE